MDKNNHQNYLVSPENSEDGNLPTVAEMNHQALTGNFQPTPLSSMMSNQVRVGQTMQGLQQLAPAPSINQNQMIVQQQLQNLQGMVGNLQPNQVLPGQTMMQNQVHTGQTMIYHDHSIVPDIKRQRIDASVSIPLMQMQGSAHVPGIMNVQQLAAAAMEQGRGRKKSQEQIDRRRERNRILARRTRLRKKFFFESLQKEVMDLQRENLRLKSIVKDEIDTDEGRRILEECDAAEKMPAAVLEACCEGENGLDMQDYNLVQSIQNSQHAFIITDPSLADNPIVFASDDFLSLTGYSREQVLGRNCRFLQGTDTSIESVQEIRKAISEGEDIGVTLLNYMADGTPFWNRLFIAALRDAQNNIVNFIGVTVKVPGPDPDGDEDSENDDISQTQTSTNKKGNVKAENTLLAMEDSFTPAVTGTNDQ